MTDGLISVKSLLTIDVHLYCFEKIARRFIRELKQPRRRRRQQKPHKFAYLTMKNSNFARYARAFFTF